MHGLALTVHYRMRDECLDTGVVHRGSVLLHHGLHTGLHGDLDATVIRLRRR
ncbi:hypothetical protein ACWGI8_25570 [Streptomyces sp. NPDC054841]